MDTIDDSIHVLVVEDEESYREALTSGLSHEGFEVATAADGIDALRQFSEHRPDIVLLDLLLPGMHGIEVCRRMRAIAPVPIVMVSAIDTELDVVLGLELGAAGYVTKPFHLRELVARMHAILRRIAPRVPPPVPAVTWGMAAGAEPEEELRPDAGFGAVSVDFVRREVTVDGVMTHLSRREFDLLAVLLTPSRRVRTRDELIDLLWPDRYPVRQPHPRHPRPPSPVQAGAGPGGAPLHRHRPRRGLPHRPGRHPGGAGGAGHRAVGRPPAGRLAADDPTATAVVSRTGRSRSPGSGDRWAR